MPRVNHLEKEHVDRLSSHVYSSNDNKSVHSTLNGEFILYQILLERISEGDQLLVCDTETLLEYFQPTDENDIKTFEEFDKEYRPTKAIHWYTRETCIYKILNKALRTQNIDDIVPFGPFIRDLNKQLSDEHKKFIRKQKTQIIQIYRGQLISKDEINRIKSTKGQLISVNSLLSTSTNRKKALEFAISKPPPNDELTSILLEINVNISQLTKPYADIRNLSAFPEEEEILLMFGCIFRLNNIKFDENMKLWIANFTLCSEEDEEIKRFRSNTRSHLKGKNVVLFLGECFIQTQNYELAEKHFVKILKKQLLKDPLELAFGYFGLSQANSKQGHFERAITSLNKSIEYLTNSTSYNQHSLLTDCYNELASIYTLSEIYKEAFDYYSKALQVKNSRLNKTYFGLGELHFQMKNYPLSLEYLQISIQYFNQDENAFIAQVFLFIAKVSSKMNRIDKALEMCGKALEY